MQRILKISKISVLILGVLTVILFIAAQIMQEKVAEIIINSLNKNISTKLEARSYRLSFLRKFPRASLELKDVLVHSSQRFDRKSFGGIDTDTLISASVISVEFRLQDVLSGNYTIGRIGAKSGKIHLYSDKSGNVNYEITEKNPEAGSDSFSLDLDKIYLNDIYAKYNDLDTDLLLEGTINDGKLKIRIAGDNIDLLASGSITVEGFHLSGTHMTRPIDSEIDLSILDNSKGVIIRKGVMKMNNYDFSVEGLVSDDNSIDLKIKGNNVDISNIRDYLPQKYSDYLSRYDPEGKLEISGTVKGSTGTALNPHIEASCILKNGKIEYGKSPLSVRNLSFSAYYTNGSENKPETSALTVRDFRAAIGSADFSGSFSMTRFNRPRANLKLQGKIIPAELRDFFGITELSSAGGYADVDINLKTDEWPSGISLASILSTNPSAEISFSSLTVGVRNDSTLLRNISGSLSFGQTTRTSLLDFNYNGQQIRLSGEFFNLPGWLASDGSLLRVTARADFSRFIPEVYLAYGNDEDSLKAFSLPGDIYAKIDFTADTLEYKKFKATGISGSLSYKPYLLTFSAMNFDAIEGSVSGSGFLARNYDGSFVSKGNYNLKNIDIYKAFNTFNNFGQDFIKAENISGRLSGSLSLLLPMDSILAPDIKSITAEGNYLVSNGALTDFEPVKELSAFIELSELQNIRFEELENDFYIRNNRFFLPQMEVRSSAADLDVSGSHGFDNLYEYHVKVRLSDILSGKHRKNRTGVTEFGVVEDDGLGRTSILLKIEGNDEDLKVAYDFKAATAGVKNNMKKEKENLKGILNQEYGWFGSDTAATAKPAEKKQRFRISWEEGKEATASDPPPEQKKKNPIKNLFKKNEN